MTKFCNFHQFLCSLTIFILAKFTYGPPGNLDKSFGCEDDPRCTNATDLAASFVNAKYWNFISKDAQVRFYSLHSFFSLLPSETFFLNFLGLSRLQDLFSLLLSPSFAVQDFLYLKISVFII